MREHPLARRVLEILCEPGPHDQELVARALAGPGSSKDPYRKVAKDVLKYLEKRGLARYDADYWWQPVRPARIFWHTGALPKWMPGGWYLASYVTRDEPKTPKVRPLYYRNFPRKRQPWYAGEGSSDPWPHNVTHWARLPAPPGYEDDGKLDG